jgi:hypothetical protein
MNTHARTLGTWLLVVGGCLLCVLAMPMARFCYEFPAIPVFLTVTFWRDAAAFALIAVAGAALTVWGIVRLSRPHGKNC